MNASMETQRLFFQSSEVNMFIPVDSAFASIGNLVDVDIMNQSMIGMVSFI